MTFDEVKKIKPGTKVFVMFKGEKLRGVFGNALGAKGFDPVIKFGDGAVAVITPDSAAMVQIDLTLN